MFTSQAHRDSGVAFACMRAPVGTFTGRLCSIMSSLGGVKNVSGESLGQRNNYSDLEKFSSFLDDNVEFYHDQGGVTLGKQNLTDSVKKNICGKVTRELVPGTLQVHYMKGYGAVEMGVHRFHHPGHEDTEGLGEGKFIHLWQYKDGAWKITRVISYDHRAAK